jgi:hypothetical protein
LFAGGGVFAIEDFATLKQDEFVFHGNVFRSERMNDLCITLLASSGRAVVKFCRIVASREATGPITDSFTDTGR